MEDVINALYESYQKGNNVYYEMYEGSNNGLVKYKLYSCDFEGITKEQFLFAAQQIKKTIENAKEVLIINGSLQFYKNNMDNEYNYKLDMKKEFEEQEMSDITKAILANIFRDYWATPYQKEKIKAKEKFDLQIIEEEKKEKYNPDNLFKDKKEEKVIENKNLPTQIKKETFFKKLIDFIKGLFRKTN